MKKVLSLVLCFVSVLTVVQFAVRANGGSATAEYRVLENGTAEITSCNSDSELLTNSGAGDLDGDGVITIKDAVKLFKILAGKDGYRIQIVGREFNPAADINGDGEVNIIDAIIIFKHISGKQLIIWSEN